MAQITDKLAKITAAAMISLGALMYIAYLVYLPAPHLFEAETKQAQNIGLILYSLATAGAGFLAWGLLLSKSAIADLERRQVLKTTGVGLCLLGLMRLGAALFPHQPFDQFIIVPAVEFIVFTALGIRFMKT